MSSNTSPQRITTPFGPQTTAADVIDGIDLSGKRAIVTGASSGLGAETARVLAGAGAEVTLAVRDTAAGELAAAAIAAQSGGGGGRAAAGTSGAGASPAVRVERLDLADLASVAAFAERWSGPLHLLVNNAGVMALPELRRTPQGSELQFATNHLGHFALALGLHDALAAGAGAGDGGARIVSLSSLVHMYSPVALDDLAFAARPYVPVLAYAQSKTANVLFAVEATRRWAADGIFANALHPGVIFDTQINRHLDPAALEGADEGVAYRFKTIEQGAATSVLLAASPLLEAIGGRYFQDCNEAGVVDRDPADEALPESGVARFARDPETAERLWEASLGLTRR